MERTIKLTESDITRIVRRIIQEDEDDLELLRLDGDEDYTPDNSRKTTWNVSHPKKPKKYNYNKRHGDGQIVGREITDEEDAIKYTRGTKISVRNLMSLIEKGHRIYVYSNKDNVTGPGGRHKKVFLNYTTGDAYTEKDEHLGNFKGIGGLNTTNHMLVRFENYLEI